MEQKKPSVLRLGLANERNYDCERKAAIVTAYIKMIEIPTILLFTTK